MNAAATDVYFENNAAVHNATGGHFGVTRTIQLLKQRDVVITPDIKRVVKRYIDKCAICQKIRHRQLPVAASVYTTAVTEPFTVASQDPSLTDPNSSLSKA